MKMKRLTASLVLAAGLWAVMFAPCMAAYVDFWAMMTLSALGLAGLASWFNPGWWRALRFGPAQWLWGIGLAVALWAVFWVGDKVSAWLLSFARTQVDSIYGMKTGEQAWVLTVLMLFLIGPAEEIFWRGYVQRTLADRFSPNAGYVLATLLYAGVHAPSCNFMLLMAAAVAGAVWGLFYRLLPGHLTALIVSHALWDVAVFIWFPI